MNAAPSLEAVILRGLHGVPHECADLFFTHVEIACRSLKGAITLRDLERTVAVAVTRCQRECPSCAA